MLQTKADLTSQRGSLAIMPGSPFAAATPENRRENSEKWGK